MPVIKIQHICSSSSEDPVSAATLTRVMVNDRIQLAYVLKPQNQPAENLMVLEGCKKWCCVSAGEKKAIVIMQVSDFMDGL